MDYIKPKTEIENKLLRANLLAGSCNIPDDGGATDEPIAYDICPECGKRGGNHKGWCSRHKNKH